MNKTTFTKLGYNNINEMSKTLGLPNTFLFELSEKTRLPRMAVITISFFILANSAFIFRLLEDFTLSS